eukprot:2476306-Prymnesium_polylepis.1
MYRCTRDGCDHQRMCELLLAVRTGLALAMTPERPVLLLHAAVQTTAEPTPSHPEPIVTPIPVALRYGKVWIRVILG